MSEPKIRELQRRGQKVVEVDFGEYRGQRKRVTVADVAAGEKLVKEHKDKVARVGRWWTGLEDEDRLEVESTVVAIHNAGFRLPHVWAEFRRMQKLNQAVENPCKYADAVEDWGQTKLGAGKGQRYVTAGKSTLLKFAAGRTQAWIHEFTAPELETWLNEQTEDKKWELATKQTYQNLFSSLWTVAVRKKWSAVNIVDSLEPITRPGIDIKIYSLQQERNLMAAMLATEDTKRALLEPVLTGWCCMRPQEVTSEKAILNGDPPFSWGDNRTCTP